MGVQLEYISHLLQFFENISYYAGIMLNAFSDLLCSKLCWHNRLVPTLVHRSIILLSTSPPPRTSYILPFTS